MRKCTVFVSTPGEKFFEEMYYKGIRPIKESNLDVFSFFDRPLVGEFSKEIHIHIAFSNIVLAIITDAKANVLYELGLAVGNGKPIIPITAIGDVKVIPTMINSINAVTYDRENPNWNQLTLDLSERCMKILTGEYMELRRRTHIELLLKQSKVMARKNTRTKKKPLSGDFLGDAIAAYKNENHMQVINLLGPIVERGTADATTYFYLSDAYFLCGESLPEGEKKYTYYRKQLDVALQGYRLFEHHQDIQKNLGLAYLKLKDLSKAQNVFEDLVSKHPNYIVARYNLACVYAQRGDLFPCMDHLSKIIEKDTSWRSLARVDPDFEPFWRNDLFQRLLFPIPTLK